MNFNNFNIIHVYTRAEAIQDGTLVDVTSTARQYGFICPVAVTNALYQRTIVPDEKALQLGESETGRLGDMLCMLMIAIKKSAMSENTLRSVFISTFDGKQQSVVHKAEVSAGDQGEMVMTLMELNED